MSFLAIVIAMSWCGTTAAGPARFIAAAHFRIESSARASQPAGCFGKPLGILMRGAPTFNER
jgi:hypothetical protein